MANRSAKYSLPQVALHWLLVAGIVFLIGLGWYMAGIPKGAPARAYYFNLHKSIGLITAFFILLFVWRRVKRPPPPLPDTLPRWQVTATNMGHVLLYVCLVAVPASGYIGSNFTKYGINFFGYPLPPWGPDDKTVYAFFNGLHYYGAYFFLAVIVVHAAAALEHFFIRKDGVLERMLP